MKKLILTILTCLLVTSVYAEQKCDAILTKDNFQIQCIISNIGDNEIQYKDCSNSDSEVLTISIKDLRKVYLADGTIVDYTKGTSPDITKATQSIEQRESTGSQASKEVREEPIQNAPHPEKFDIIITTDAQKIEAKIIEVSKTEIKYKEIDNLDGPTFILATEEINSIIYANGKVTAYNQSAPQRNSEETMTEASTTNQINEPAQNEDYNLARVENYSGVLVFMDCTPVVPYEVLGDVTNSNQSQGGFSSSYYRVGGMVVSNSSYTSTPQYTDIRDQLVINAVMANREVEGILITIPKEGEGRATMIKFTDSVGDKTLARVSSHLGLWVFTDCTPVTPYSFVGKIKNAGGLNSAYFNLRDRLINKVLKKYPEAKGVITHLVSGGKDSAEAIKF